MGNENLYNQMGKKLEVFKIKAKPQEILNVFRVLWVVLFLLGSSYGMSQDFDNRNIDNGKVKNRGQANKIEIDQIEAIIKENSSLMDLLNYAQNHNPGLQAAFENWQAARQLIPQAKALPNPIFSYSYYIREVETRVGPQQHKVGLMQPFPWFGKQKLRGNIAEEAAKVAKQQYENLKLQVFYRVKNAYYEFYFTMQTISILKENLRLLESLEQVLLTQYRTGTTAYVNVLKIQVESEKLKERLNSTSQRLLPVKARLNAVLNRPSPALLPIPVLNLASEPWNPGIDELSQRMKHNNPSLKVLHALELKNQTALRLAKKNRYPDFSIGLDYIFTAKTSMPGIIDSGKDPLMAMVSVQLPIWGKKNNASIEEAKARFNAASYSRKEVENELQSQLELVYYQYDDARRKVSLYKDSLIPRAQQAMEVARSAFESGSIDFTGFIDTQRTLLVFQLELEQAKTQSVQRQAELEMFSGKEKDNPSVPSVSSVVQKKQEEK